MLILNHCNSFNVNGESKRKKFFYPTELFPHNYCQYRKYPEKIGVGVAVARFLLRTIRIKKYPDKIVFLLICEFIKLC
jgi:hypothetical protein